MELFRIKRDIPFMRHALVLNMVSVALFVAAVFFLVTRGLHLSIEFTGGTVLEVQYAQAADVGRVRSQIESLGFGEVQVQNFGTSRDVLIRVPLRGEAASRRWCPGSWSPVPRRGRTPGAAPGRHLQGEAVSRQVCEAVAASRCGCSAASSSARRWAPNWPATAPSRWR
ncbi:MAG: hypothetical protein KatS3mg122_1122 [Caldimonas sp.]|nr:MAG: hypothetical protein KatS3mg122_1122 [Caldimonas sp.]